MHPELRRRPISCGLRVASSLVRSAAGRPLVVVPFLADGTKVVADLRTSFGRGLYRYRVPYVDEDFEILRRYLRPGDTFVDCGANIGHFSLVAARLVGPSGHVVAFEPVAETRAALERNVATNGLTNVEVLPWALGATAGVAPFYAMADGGGLSSFAPSDPARGREFQVDVKTIDDCLRDIQGSVRLVKIDVEGAESVVLQGATELLRRYRPPLLVEVEDDHLKRQGTSEVELRELLRSFGYREEPTQGPSPNVLFVATDALART